MSLAGLHVCIRGGTQAHARIHFSSLHMVSMDLHPSPRAGPRHLLPPCHATRTQRNRLPALARPLNSEGHRKAKDIGSQFVEPPIPCSTFLQLRSLVPCHICDRRIRRGERALNGTVPPTLVAHTAASFWAVAPVWEGRCVRPCVAKSSICQSGCAGQVFPSTLAQTVLGPVTGSLPWVHCRGPLPAHRNSL